MNSSIPGVSQLTSKRALRPDTTYPIEPPVGMTVMADVVSSDVESEPPPNAISKFDRHGSIAARQSAGTLRCSGSDLDGERPATTLRLPETQRRKM